MADMKNRNDYQCTHATTDLGLWWPSTDQGKTPWRDKKKWGKLSMGKKPNTER